jgi:hypothetical protein
VDVLRRAGPEADGVALPALIDLVIAAHGVLPCPARRVGRALATLSAGA